MLNVSNLQMVSINSETILPITLYGTNRSLRVTEWHRRVMVDYLGIPINYIEAPFHLGASHGQVMNYVLAQTLDAQNAPDYYWWWDNDCIALDRSIIEHVYNTVKNKKTLWGQAWNSSHKTGPNGTNQHPYASQACLCFSRSLYNALGRPDCDHNNPRSDTAEEITWACEEKGYTLALQYPSYSDTKTTQLSGSCWYGRGNVYGPDLTYHESRADLEDHEERFIHKCQEVLSHKYGV